MTARSEPLQSGIRASKLSRLSPESRRLIFSLVDHVLSLESPSKRFGGS